MTCIEDVPRVCDATPHPPRTSVATAPPPLPPTGNATTGLLSGVALGLVLCGALLARRPR